MKPEPVVKADWDGRQILFMTKLDCLLFTANFGNVISFVETFNKLYGKTDNPSVMFNYYRTHRWQREIARMLESTKLSDGSTLAKAIQEKAQNDH